MKQELINSIPESVNIQGFHAEREVLLNDEILNAHYSQRIMNHSPDGFNWGYGGSGPAQLSLAILLEYLPIKEALSIYQDFKFSVVAGFPQTNFSKDIDLRQLIQNIVERKKQKTEQNG